MINPQPLSPILGIDIGGTKLAAGVVDREGQVVSYLREPTPITMDAEEIFDAVLKLSKAALAQSGIIAERVGIGCGGPSRFNEGIVSPLHIPAWRNFPLKAKIEAALGLKVIVDNDSKALALGEAVFGAGRGSRCMLGMVVSTGVGGGIVVDGKLFHGISGNAGHIGHVIVARNGPRCDCGAVGCLTCYASGTGLAERAHIALKRGVATSLSSLPLDEITARAIVAAALEGDSLSLRLMRDASHALARAIASTAALFELDRVVIGGGVAQSGELLFGPLRQELKRRATLSFTRDLPVLPAALGPESGVIGAAALAQG